MTLMTLDPLLHQREKKTGLSIDGIQIPIFTSRSASVSRLSEFVSRLSESVSRLSESVGTISVNMSSAMPRGIHLPIVTYIQHDSRG